MDELEWECLALIERISGYPISESARSRILAEVKATHRRERAAESDIPRRPPPVGLPGEGGT